MPYTWQVEKYSECDGGNTLWADMEAAFSNQIESAREQGQCVIEMTSPLYIPALDKASVTMCEYTLDLVACKQINHTTQTTRNIRLIEIKKIVGNDGSIEP